MRRSFYVWLGILMVLSFSGAGWAQKDPLQGRWEGTLKTQRGEVQAKVTFKKEGKEGTTYSGTISGMQRNVEFPFKEVKLEKDKVNTKVQFETPQGSFLVNIKFNLKGETLKGRGDVNLAGQSLEFAYELKRVGDLVEQAAAPGVPSKPQLGQAGSKLESDAFEKLRAEPDATAKKRLIAEFLKQFPDSGLNAFVYQEGAYLGQQLNDFDLMTDHGEKSLTLLPENFSLMTILANAYVERNVVDKAEEHAEKAIDLVTNAQKPDKITEDQWKQSRNMLLATNFSTLGYVHLRRALAIQNAAEKKAETERAIAPFKKAIEYYKNDDISYWRMGVAYYLLNDYPNAESNLARAVALNGVAVNNARTVLEDIYKGQHKGSLDGLDKVIAKAKGELAVP